MDQHNVVRLGGQGGQGVGYRFLAVVAAFHHLHAAGKAVLGYLGLNAFHLGFAHGHIDRRDPLDGGKGAQRMDQDREAAEDEKLFGLRSRHPGAQPRGRKNREYLHNWWSIQRRGTACGRHFMNGAAGVRGFPSLPSVVADAKNRALG